MAGKSLFNYDQRENELRIPNRPLGEMSDFVVEQMPARLAEIREGTGDINSLVHDVELIIAELGHVPLDQILVDVQAQELAAFDLKVMEAGIVHTARLLNLPIRPSENLVIMVDAFAKATDQPPVLTYEELILINPVQDRRTFTNGDLRKSEVDFYEGHRIIESHMDEVLRRFRWAIFFLSDQGKGGVDKARLILQQALVQMRSLPGYTRIIGQDMTPHDFNLFREYLGEHPIRENTRGASGAFSATIPVAELLLGGENLPKHRLRYLEDYMPFFPRNGRKAIKDAREKVQAGLTLNNLYKAVGKPEALGSMLQKSSHIIHSFRRIHLKAVERQLPSVFKGEAKGTSGESVEFLERRIDTKHIP